MHALCNDMDYRQGAASALPFQPFKQKNEGL